MGQTELGWPVSKIGKTWYGNSLQARKRERASDCTEVYKLLQSLDERERRALERLWAVCNCLPLITPFLAAFGNRIPARLMLTFNSRFQHHPVGKHQFLILHEGTACVALLALVFFLTLHASQRLIPQLMARVFKGAYARGVEATRKDYERRTRLIRLKSHALTAALCLSALISVLSLNSHTLIDDAGIVTNEFPYISQTRHQWSSVSQIELDTDWRFQGRGDRVGHQVFQFRVYFSDDSSWESPDSDDRQWLDIHKAMEFAALRSGREIE